MSARIARIYKNLETLKDGSPNPNFDRNKSACWMEYFQEEKNRFVLDLEVATLYPSHGEADDLAAAMRAKGEYDHVFAVTCPRTKPPPPSITHRPPRPRRETEEQHKPMVKLFGYSSDD